MKYLVQIYRVIFLFLCVYFVYQGLTHAPSEGDSLAYHLPIAQNILHGKWTNFENPAQPINSLLQYYPAASHLILALFVFFQIPELFNVVGFMLFALSSYFLARQLEIQKHQAFCLAIVLATLTSAMRLLLTQTIDMWVAVFFTLSLALLLKPRKEKWYGLSLGIAIGMLIGSKFTGLGLAGILVIFFLPTICKVWKSLVIPIFIFGLSWYLRNFLTRGDWLYPASNPHFHLDEWMTWQSLVQKQLLSTFIQDLISEYSVWAITLVVGPALLLSKWNRRIPQLAKLIGIGLGCFILHLVTPASAANMLSDLRYTLPTFVCLITAMFLWAQKEKKVGEFFVVATIPIVSIFTLVVSHQPKVFFSASILVTLYYVYVHATKYG